MPSRNVSGAYLKQAFDLLNNTHQLAAYNSTGNCVVLAGPGSGKTKTLVLKLARMMAEDVRAPRGIACITYSQECARELNRRFDQLGLNQAPNLFVGTVHGFCLRHLLMPYGKLSGLPIPDTIKLATTKQSEVAFARVGERLYGVNHPYKILDMGRHRRAHIDRTSTEWLQQEELVALSVAYEDLLRRNGLIDFDDLVIYGQMLVNQCDWVLPLVQARFPILAIDEYQDLGIPLDRIVKRLVFDGGVRLFAVGDADQSIYGFTGADGDLLLRLAEREDVETVRLQLNYRSAGRIVRASEMALGVERGYRPFDLDRQARIEFVECPNGIGEQAENALSVIIPAALEAKPGRRLGDIAILYKDAKTGDIVAAAAGMANIDFIRVDNSAPYRKCALTSWIEDCAAWCSGGWRDARPKLGGLISRWLGFRRLRMSASAARNASERLTRFLMDHRQAEGPAALFVSALRTELIDSLLDAEPGLADQREQVVRMGASLGTGGALEGLELKSLGGRDGSPEHLNLMTLHSAKGCEYDVVIMVGLDLGVLPWRGETPTQLQESRRIFYVGLTRARDEVHMLYSGWIETRYGRMALGRSPFLDELEDRMAAAETDEDA